jgi:nitroimidazol reductase NimA-like FMN-containing flavoprotein (pyridoxamine 5'-phosphate oxidase superfamily)
MPFIGGDPVALARSIVEANRYLTLATADQDGLPWASPVWFASADFREFFWVSSPDAQHSRNVAVRPEVAVVIFNSGQPIGTGRAVYLSARAELVPEPDLDRGIATFSLASQAQGGRAWGRADVQEPARHRLYRATAVTSYVLSETDERVLVDLA